jgi:hypothetical protein
MALTFGLLLAHALEQALRQNQQVRAAVIPEQVTDELFLPR